MPLNKSIYQTYIFPQIIYLPWITVWKGYERSKLWSRENKTKTNTKNQNQTNQTNKTTTHTVLSSLDMEYVISVFCDCCSSFLKWDFYEERSEKIKYFWQELRSLAHSPSWEEEGKHILTSNRRTALAILDSTTVKPCNAQIIYGLPVAYWIIHTIVSLREKIKALRYWACYWFLWNLGRNSKGFGYLSERKLPSPT